MTSTNKTPTGRLLFLLTLAFVSSRFLMAAPAPMQKRPVQKAQRTLPSLWSWTSEQWSGDDQPYRDIRRDLDQAASQGQLDATMIEAYRMEWQKHPQDPKALFRWVYACYLAQQAHTPIHLKQIPSWGVFAFVPSPHTYDYTRLRFLIAARTEHAPELVVLANHLLQHQPDDRDVRYSLIRCYRPWLSKTDQQKALSAAQDFIRRYPQLPGGYASMGDVYFAIWIFHQEREQSEADKAIAAYQESLRHLPYQDEFRLQVEKLIHLIQTHESAK